MAILPLLLIQEEQMSVNNLIVKECTLSTGKLPPEDLPRNSPDITSAVYRGRKALNQTNKSNKIPTISHDMLVRDIPWHHMLILSLLTDFLQTIISFPEMTL